jgi:6-pyruvoyltetrahydropterin/6-carboxytetrahydropterin synthase
VPVFSITVERSFTASHQLMLPGGSREPLHSHDWLVRVTVAASHLDNMGLVMDFNRLAAFIDDSVKLFAGHTFEQFEQFQGVNASAENVAAFIYGCLQPRLDGRVRLRCVRVMEAPGCWAEYSSD